VRIPLAAAVLVLIPSLGFAYTLGAGDDIAVEVRAAQTTLSLRMVVSVDGRIAIAPAGAFVAAGKTPAELEREIAQGLGNYYVGPVQAVVLVVAPKQVKVSVLGEVGQPGEQSLPGDRPLLSQAIAKAGGLAPQASWRRVTLVRGGQALGPFDLYAILKRGRSELDMMLRPDDVIYVPAREQWASVVGPAQEPGVYELLPGDRVTTLIATAGGLTLSADQERAVIERGSRTVEVLLRAALAHPGGGEDLLLEASDVVRLGSRRSQVYVLGEVTEPGARPYDDNRGLLDYIGAAGGMTTRAAPRKVAIVRPGAPAPTVIPVDLTELTAGRAQRAAPPLQPGDLIFVPERRFATVQDWTGIAQVLVTLLVGGKVF
jgi:protein involved in polysaccharide export with SLBB domain